ncbi:DUF4337 domain-containing protein [Hyphomicrobium sp. CS1GBMeth3]|uniref:DUF4337 domain-containing protein n=1 Tax=Hyphomicrobium sp. CS1GBMeth3 TaxID=1892845 RepID=UPI000930BFC2|nr:DUF4337 domain-containing protein [Hyphomicrobium sp. CS1GBMeth3]
MAFDDLGRDATDQSQRNRDRWIGVYIGVLAVTLAICSLGGGNAAKEATLKNIEASNTWAFFQAKNLRRQMLRMQLDEFELVSLSDPNLSGEAKTAISAKIASYREQDKILTSDPKSNEGLDELFHRGKALEAERDIAIQKDPYFDYAQALLQIAIVLASVAIISGGTAVLVASIGVGILGALLTLNGFTLLLAIPLIG